ncbi:hypothetical protein ISCGN_000799 [Ixodes scapularis]
MVFLLWTPAHAGVPLAGNEAAHAAARGLTRRAAADTVAASAPESGAVATAAGDVTTEEQQQQPEWSWGDRLTTVQGHHPTSQIKQTQIPATTRQAKQNRGRNLEIAANAHLPQPGDSTPLLPEPIPDGRV